MSDRASIENRLRPGLSAMGWPSLRPSQVAPLSEILDDKDVLCILPTGAGKSALFQLPAIGSPGTTLVLSPLIALMMDQVERLRQNKVPAATLNSMLSAGARQRVLQDLQSQQLDLLYCSPEGLARMDRRIFGETTIDRVVIDEAHCISEHGWDFRPHYRKIAKSLERIFGTERPPILAVTATATNEVADDIEDNLQMKRPVRITTDSNRPELYLGVCGPTTELLRMVGRGGVPCVVYSSTRAGTETAANELSNAGYRAEAYHAGLPKSLRWKRQCAFQNGEIEVLAATCAYGMGVDGTIRSVVHLQMPTSLEAYSQEAGRAGRDGKPSFSIVRATPEALLTARLHIDHTWPRPRVVSRFWSRLRRWFIQDTQRLEANGVLHRNIREIGDAFGISPVLAGSCIRILIDNRHLQRLGVAELPMRVTLNRAEPPARGSVQRSVFRQLCSACSQTGVVVGSVNFFKSIGLNEEMAKTLRNQNLLRVDWPSEQPVFKQLDDEPLRMPPEDIEAIRARQIERVGWATSFLREKTCRREVLLRYFGSAGDVGGPHCCDLCTRAGRKQQPYDGSPAS